MWAGYVGPMALMSPSWTFPDLQGFIHAFLRGLVNVANEIVIEGTSRRHFLRPHPNEDERGRRNSPSQSLGAEWADSATAATLRKAGFDVSVYEQAAQFAQSAPAYRWLNAMKVLRELGLERLRSPSF